MLRATAQPDPTADRGGHVFTYSLLPHEGDFFAGNVIQEAYALNVPLIAAQTRRKDAPVSWLSVDAPNVIVETIKPAEKEPGAIVRLYEAANRFTRCALTGAFDRVVETDLNESPVAKESHCSGRVTATFKPFEIKTYRVRTSKGG